MFDLENALNIVPTWTYSDKHSVDKPTASVKPIWWIFVISSGITLGSLADEVGHIRSLQKPSVSLAEYFVRTYSPCKFSNIPGPSMLLRVLIGKSMEMNQRSDHREAFSRKHFLRSGSKAVSVELHS